MIRLLLVTVSQMTTILIFLALFFSPLFCRISMIVEPIFIFFQVIHQKTRISYDEITNDLCPVSLSLSFSVCGFQDEEQSIVDQICFFFFLN